MNRAEYQAISDRIAALEVRCELLEAELKATKAASFEAMVAAEQERVIKSTRKSS